MKITTQLLKSSILNKGYKWFSDRPNLIGVRTSIDSPNLFNDLFCLSWTQEKMMDGLTSIQKQQWLNNNLYFDPKGAILKEDGDFGKNSEFAYNTYLSEIGKERLKVWQITTDPGTYWLNNPLNRLGTAVLKPNQWVDSWSIGNHQGKSDHPALVQTSKITVYRDNDKDNLSEMGKEDVGLFGINIHRSNATGRTMTIGKWSAGCQVFQTKSDFDQLLRICNLYRKRLNNKFTYTLILERDLI